MNELSLPPDTTVASPSASACRASSRLGRAAGRTISESGLTPAGYRLLGHLESGGDSAATELAQKLRVSKPAVTATIDWLELRGLVVRSSDPRDGRRVKVASTASGREALRRADGAVAARLSEILSHLSTERHSRVLEALEYLSDALDADRRQRIARAEATT